MPKPAPGAMARFEVLLPVGPGITRRLVFGQPAAFLRGNMFLGVFGKDLFVRLNDADRAEAMGTKGVVPFEPAPGRRMAEYVVLPESVLERPGQAKDWVRRSRAWVETLPSKAPGTPASQRRRTAVRSGDPQPSHRA
jgi:TfoX/Sxy family transcriptional regulator of competence genes